MKHITHRSTNEVHHTQVNIWSTSRPSQHMMHITHKSTYDAHHTQVNIWSTSHTGHQWSTSHTGQQMKHFTHKSTNDAHHTQVNKWSTSHTSQQMKYITHKSTYEAHHTCQDRAPTVVEGNLGSTRPDHLSSRVSFEISEFHQVWNKMWNLFFGIWCQKLSVSHIWKLMKIENICHITCQEWPAARRYWHRRWMDPDIIQQKFRGSTGGFWLVEITRRK